MLLSQGIALTKNLNLKYMYSFIEMLSIFFLGVTVLEATYG